MKWPPTANDWRRTREALTPTAWSIRSYPARGAPTLVLLRGANGQEAARCTEVPASVMKRCANGTELAGEVEAWIAEQEQAWREPLPPGWRLAAGSVSMMESVYTHFSGLISRRALGNPETRPMIEYVITCQWLVDQLTFDPQHSWAAGWDPERDVSADITRYRHVATGMYAALTALELFQGPDPMALLKEKFARALRGVADNTVPDLMSVPFDDIGYWRRKLKQQGGSP